MNHYPMSSHSVLARSCISVLVRDTACVCVQVQVKDYRYGSRPSSACLALVSDDEDECDVSCCHLARYQDPGDHPESGHVL